MEKTRELHSTKHFLPVFRLDWINPRRLDSRAGGQKGQVRRRQERTPLPSSAVANHKSHATPDRRIPRRSFVLTHGGFTDALLEANSFGISQNCRQGLVRSTEYDVDRFEPSLSGPTKHSTTYARGDEPSEPGAAGVMTDVLDAVEPRTVEEVTIEAGQGLRGYWADLWRYRELFYFLAWRDLAVRYKQTLIGVVWSVVQPVSTMIVFTIVFGRLAGLPSNGDPYAVLVFAGLLPWQFFSNSLLGASASLISNASMISKIYFPRLALPVAAEIVVFADLLISFVILLILMVLLGVPLTPKMLTLPAFVLLAAAAALGAGVWTGALNVRYRDFRYVVPFAVQLGLYISPVGFSSSVVPQQWQLLYSLNPMVGVIDGFRWAILPSSPPIYLPGLALSVVIVTVVLGTGLRYFRSTERTFADVI